MPTQGVRSRTWRRANLEVFLCAQVALAMSEGSADDGRLNARLRPKLRQLPAGGVTRGRR